MSSGDVPSPHPYGGKPIPPSIGEDLYFITFSRERGVGCLHGRGVWGRLRLHRRGVWDSPFTQQPAQPVPPLIDEYL